MIKSLKKDDVSAVPFVVSKRWRATSKENTSLLLGDVDFEYVIYSSSFSSESGDTFTSEESSSTSSSFIAESFTTGVAGFLSTPLALEFIDYGDGWQFGCTSSLRNISNYEILVEDTSSYISIEAASEFFLLESYNELSTSRDPYNGPTYRFDLTMDVPFTNSSCDLCLEQSEDNFLTFEDGIQVDSYVKFNPDIEPQNLNNTYKRITYNQIKNLFYNNSNDPTKLLGLENFDVFLDAKNRVVYDNIKVVTIPQAYFGDKIVENSVEIIEDSGDQVYTIVDDGRGNLHARENIFSVIVSDANKDINYFNSASYVNFSNFNFSVNDIGVSSSINWQYYKNNILYVNRDVIEDFVVHGYTINDVVTPISYNSNLIYVGEAGTNLDVVSLPHEDLLGYFRKIECGTNFVVALKSSGDVVTWGDSTITTTIPTFDTKVRDISVGDQHAIAIDDNGKIYVWGTSTYTGSLPTVTNNYRYIKAGPSGSVAIHTNGRIYGFGHSSCNLFTNIPQVGNIDKVEIGSQHGIILDNNGDLYSWSSNSDYSQSLIPTSAETGIQDVVCGDDHTIALKTDGRIIAWGKNNFSQSFIPFGESLTDWAVVAGGIATVGLADVSAVLAKGNRSVASQRRITDAVDKPYRFTFAWGQHPFTTEYSLTDIHLGRNYTILDPNVNYQQLVYTNDYTSPTILKGALKSTTTLNFDINLNGTKEYNLTDYKVKISKLHDPHGTPMFSGLGFLTTKVNNKELYSYISSGEDNEMTMSVGLKTFYLDTGSIDLSDPHYGGYRNVPTYITRLTSSISMGQTGSRDYNNTMTGRFVSYDHSTTELVVFVDSVQGSGIYDNWSIDFGKIIVNELLDELNIADTTYNRLYLSGSSYTTSSNLNSMLKDESFIEHYLENQGSYDPYT